MNTTLEDLVAALESAGFVCYGSDYQRPFPGRTFCEIVSVSLSPKRKHFFGVGVKLIIDGSLQTFRFEHKRNSPDCYEKMAKVALMSADDFIRIYG